MSYSIILDIILVAVLAISTWVAAKKGIFKSIYKLSSIALTIVAVLLLSEPVGNMIESSGLGLKIDQMVYTGLIADKEYDKELGKMVTTGEEENVSSLPEFVNNAVETAAENAIVPAVSEIVKKLVCAIIIYLIAKLLLFLIFLVIEGMFKLPLLKSANKLLGAAAGLVSGVLIVYIVCGIASLNVQNSAAIREVIDGTYIVKYFYDQNHLMNLFINL